MNCVDVANDENLPTSSQSIEQVVKKNRRRSSIGGDLMKSFFKEVEMERITTPEHNIRRNRRSAAIRADYKSKVLNNRPLRLSMDIGEQPTIKSCLTKKSTAQKAALNIVKKYRRSRSLSKTPNRRRHLRFNSICTVRVMTPRPQYDPDNLCLPSDDEDSKKPDRQRLSTVKLDITPQSQAYLSTIKDNDDAQVEFRAQMIFGDDCKNETKQSSFSSDSKKRKRRKSLIVNAASPMTTPPPAPKSNTKTDKIEQDSKRPRNCRRSLNLAEQEVVEERKTRRRSGILKVAEVPQIELKKEKRKSEVPSKKIEPEEKKVETRGRRKSGLVVPEPTKNERRRSNFFAPRQLLVSKEEIQIIEPSADEKTSQTPSEPTEEPVETEQPSISQKPVQSSSSMSSPSQPKKLFSLFSPRPSPKVLSKSSKETCAEFVDVLKDEKPVNISVCSSSSITSTGIRKEKLWGDKIPPTYCYFENTPIFQKSEVSSQKDWSKINPTFEFNVSGDFEFRLRKHEKDENVVEGSSKDETSPRVHDSRIDKYAEELETFGAHSFKPQKFEELVEGSDDIHQVRGWLRKWKKRVRKEAKKQELVEKQKKGKRSKKSTSSDEEDSDYDVSDDEELQNPLVLRGPPGVGKTAFIATLASEENMKVIGMGPDEERKGTSIKMKLTEALRSHRVISEPVGSLVRLFQSQKSVFNPKLSNGENENRQKSVLDKGFQQSLVVFEHVDLLFGSLDRNGASALIEMVNTAMVPVVWTCDEDYPTNSELEKDPLVISLHKKRSRVRKYCQNLVHIATGKWIEDDVMRKLASSVRHDLRALINQTHFYALNEKIPLPLTDRFSVSSGFKSNWDMEQNNDIENVLSSSKWNKIESKVYQYQDILNMIPDGFLKVDLPNIENIFNDKDLVKRQSDTRKQIKSAYEAFYGRYSKNNISLEMIPYLSIIDEKEQEESKKSRRYQHCFAKTMQSEYPIDDGKLTGTLAAIRKSFKFST